MLNPRLARLTDERIERSLRKRPIRQPPIEPGSLAVAMGRVIVRVRAEIELSQRQLARLLGVSPSAVSRWEAGHRFPTLSHLAKIADLAGRPASALLVATEELLRVARDGDAARDTSGPDGHRQEDDHAADD